MGDASELKQAISSALDAAVDPAVRFLGLGVDVVRIDRLRRDRSRWGARFVDKTFCAAEVEYCSSKSDPDATYAGTFAAKEAVFKALALQWAGPFSWRWIEIQRDNKRSPSVVVDDRLWSQRPDAAATIAVSITHVGKYAAAVALVTGN